MAENRSEQPNEDGKTIRVVAEDAAFLVFLQMGAPEFFLVVMGVFFRYVDISILAEAFNLDFVMPRVSAIGLFPDVEGREEQKDGVQEIGEESPPSSFPSVC